MLKQSEQTFLTWDTKIRLQKTLISRCFYREEKRRFCQNIFLELVFSKKKLEKFTEQLGKMEDSELENYT